MERKKETYINFSHICNWRWCLSSIMIYFVLLLVGWAYFVFTVFILFGFYLDITPVLTIVLSIFWHIFLLLQLTSYFKTIFVDPGFVPTNVNEVGTSETKQNGQTRYCEKCRNIKPDRAHHCRMCNRCVLKMDHHCPWVNNCVGFCNYKYFMCFLFWTFVLCLYLAIVTLPQMFHLDFEHQFSTRHIQIMVIFFVAIAFGLGLLLFWATHLKLILSNKTTIESFEGQRSRKSNVYNLGGSANWREVFGNNVWLWFIPIYTSVGDGITFPLNDNQTSHEERPPEQLSDVESTTLLV
eukprot:TRINITY_DN2541_c0_g1_i2.p1 TRINITY_DN2541_c0_g1~~TRINITY_DN2541_c0_g1_i2.p1  ORF type:complete len:295 (+),score=7.58 TRINITY_DN2541_c0_g1_i2:73-957(+)